MNAKDFLPSSPGRLVLTVDGARAFVPIAIPRTIEFSLPTINRLSEAENALGQLNGMTGRLVDPFLVGSPLLHREAILSNRIEGTITTPEELVLFEASAPSQGPRGQRAEDTREVSNYIRALRRGIARMNELPVSLRLIRELHAELMQGVRGERERPGEFRTSQNYIGNKGQSILEARFVPPPVAEMNAALADLEVFLHEDGPLPLLVRLALIHYQFETIHPFRDGNGRLGRLLIPLLLCSHARLSEPMLYMSSYLDANREEYYDLLLRTSQAGNWTRWIDFFLEGVRVCASESTDKVKELLELRDSYRAQFHSARSSALLLKLIDELFRRPSVTISQASTLLSVTPASASANIKKLVAAGVLTERTGRKRDQIFVAMEVLAFMSDVEGGARPAGPSVVEDARWLGPRRPPLRRPRRRRR